MKVVDYMLARMSEASTWQGLVVLMTFMGMNLSPEQANQIVMTGIAVVGLLKTFMPDRLPVPVKGEEKVREKIQDVLRRGRK